MHACVSVCVPAFLKKINGILQCVRVYVCVIVEHNKRLPIIILNSS